jgi:hypothetical protein
MRGAVMAVAFRMEFPGATLDQYDEVIQKMGLTPGGPTPPGAIFHWVAATDDGLLVVDVWETAEAFNKFSTEQIQPITQEVGLAEPTVTMHQVHNHLGGGA